ncbi:acylphosphatase [soil metagenome]
MTADTTRVRAVVSGRVQGVGFRFSTRAEARRLGVLGFVRNLPDGTVEAEVQGEESAVGAMLAWLEHGPAGALVDAVQTAAVEADGSASAFEIR